MSKKPHVRDVLAAWICFDYLAAKRRGFLEMVCHLTITIHPKPGPRKDRITYQVLLELSGSPGSRAFER